MFSRVLIALALVAVSAQALQWADLFSPPYEGAVPEICWGISCAAKDLCFIAGGSNGVGFDVFQFNGEMEGYLAPMNTTFTFVFMAIGMGGTKAAPHGAVGGFGFFTGLQYLANASSGQWLPSLLDSGIVEASDIRADRTGQKLLVVDQGNIGVDYSSDYGVTFTVHPIPQSIWPSANYSELMNGAMVDSQTWYATVGSFPQPVQHQGSGSSSIGHDEKVKTFARNDRAHYEVRAGKKIHRVAHKMSAEAAGSGSSSTTGIYSAGIVKTSDGGATWTSLSSDVSDFYFQEIDCVNATFCMAVSQGAGPAKVWLTTDGMTFNPVLTLDRNATHMYSLNCIRFASATQVWAAGSLVSDQNAAGIFYYSLDAGATWHMHGLLPWIVDITDMDILEDGSGYATALTEFQDSTILRLYQGPVPPMPTMPPAQQSTGTITQTVCPDQGCSGQCQSNNLPTGQCLGLQGGGSAILTCNYNPSSITQVIFNESAVCNGPTQISPLPTNQCLYSSGGGNYFESTCTAPSSKMIPTTKGRKFIPLRK